MKAGDRVSGSFKVTNSGKKSFRYAPKEGTDPSHAALAGESDKVGWHFTVYWHLE